MLQPIKLGCSADRPCTGSMSARTGLIRSLTIPMQPIVEFADIGTERISGLINCGMQIAHCPIEPLRYPGPRLRNLPSQLAQLRVEETAKVSEARGLCLIGKFPLCLQFARMTPGIEKHCGLQVHRECEKKNRNHYDHPKHDQSDGRLDIGDQQ